MKTAFEAYRQVVNTVPAAVKQEVGLEVAISNRIYDLMTKRGLSKKGLAEALDKRPCEVTKWLSGQHNFTIRTLSMLSSFFGESLITVVE